MKITGTIEYTQRYFPSKACKTPHVRVLKKDMQLEIKEFASEDVPVALCVKGKWRNGQKDDYRLYQGEFYCPARDPGTERPITVEKLIDTLNYQAKCWINSDDSDFQEGRSIICKEQNQDENSEETKTESMRSVIGNCLLIDGVLYERTGEPYYVILPSGEVSVCENSLFVTTLNRLNEYNALERGQIEAHRIFNLKEAEIRILPGYESYIRLRRQFGGYIWSDERRRYERKEPGNGPVWCIEFVSDDNLFHAEIAAASEDEALLTFIRKGMAANFPKIAVTRLP